MELRGDKSNQRIEIGFLLFSLFFAVAIGKLFWLQVVEHGFYKDKAQKMHLTTIEQQIGRGSIYDSKGGKLAFSVTTESICAEPAKVKDKAATAAALSKELGMTYASVLRKLQSRKRFEYIKRQSDPRAASAISAMNLKGIFTLQEEKRYYPMKETAAHIVGFTDIDNHGLEGIEYKYEKYLRGKLGRVLVKRDAKRRPITIDGVSINKAEAGADVHLTLDPNIQYAAQRELNQMAAKYRANYGSIIVMNPQDGAILAMGNYPPYDPNEFKKYESKAFKNTAVTAIYEPGSTFKVCTLSAFLDEFRGLNLDEFKVHCGNGEYKFFDRIVHDHEKYGLLTVPEIIKFSSNIGMVHIALKMKQERLYKEFERYGFGRLTGVDLPGEVPGIMRPVSKWDNTTLTSIPYGQEIAVTPIQVAAAYCILANGGYKVTPHIVDKIVKNGQTVYENKAGRGSRVLDAGIVEKVNSMLRDVVTADGTGKKAMIQGYKIAGKTGTSQKHNENGKGYIIGKYVSSFVGFLPADRPELLTLVVIDDPKVIYYGGDVAAPVFKAVNQSAVSYLQIPPALEDRAPEAAEVKTAAFKMPDYYMQKFADAKQALSDKNVKVYKRGFGHYVIAQKPAAGARVAPGSNVTFFLGDQKDGQNVRVYVPDVRGLTIRKTMEVFDAMGLKVSCNGSGFAVSQQPAPGVAVSKGEKCTVNFGLGDNS